MPSAISKTAEDQRTIALQHLKEGNLSQAISVLEQSARTAPQDAATWALLAEAYFAAKDMRFILCLVSAMQLEPDNMAHKERFVQLARVTQLTAHNSIIENAILECLGTASLDTQPLHALWYNMFALSPQYRTLFQTYSSLDPATRAKPSFFKKIFGGEQKDTYVFFDRSHFEKQPNLDALCTPYFILGLESLIVSSLPFESFITALRRRLLMTDDGNALLAAAVGHYCFETEYIFYVDDTEKGKVEALRAQIQQGSATARDIAVYACYEPLHGVDTHAPALQDEDLADLVYQQITSWRLLLEKKSTLAALTSVDDPTSIKVQEQYEEFPYPRWNARPKNVSDEGVGATLSASGSKILIAGCGTGSEAAQVAVAFPNADILAIDLSRSSLSYAALKCEEFGLPNIRFAQADILKLDELNDTFDAIISGGVLHHMHDWKHGWMSLYRRLKPGGLMRISLYSAMARRHIITAQQLIKKAGYPGTADGIRLFKRDAAGLLPWDTYHNIARTGDYYQQSTCRDLLFHVQEHCLDLLQIDSLLDQVGLTFLKMNVSAESARLYSTLYSQDKDGKSLANWHDFEQRYPDTFFNMYQFWCRRKEG